MRLRYRSEAEEMDVGWDVRTVEGQQSKRLAYADGPGEVVFAPGEVGAQVDMVGLAEHVAEARASGWQKLVGPELGGSRSDCTNTDEPDDAEPPGEFQTILDLGGDHEVIEVASCGIAAQLVICTVDALGVEGR